MILDEFALLASDTARTKAYLQAMILAEKLPGVCIVYSDDIKKMQSEAEQYKKENPYKEYFDINEPVLYSIKKAGISFILEETKDINSEEMENILSGLKQKYIIYSGYGAYILKPHLFKLDKKYVHVHAGILPQYRGSTTAYYSFLQEESFGATAIFLSEGIDEGGIITQEVFGTPKETVDIDYIYEPYMRSQVLLKVLNEYVEKNHLESKEQAEDGAETYFIIHPVLKHLAMLKLENIWSKDN